MEKMIQKMAEKVDEFHQKVTHPPYHKGALPETSRYRHMREELDEIMMSHDANDFAGVVDGLVDLVYVALGTLLQMGIDPDYPFDMVHQANMMKRGEKTERHEHDAVKPEGWQPPNYDELLERVDILNQVSPVFVDLTRLRIKKGKNYNRGGVKRMDHFPLGDKSFFQMTWLKMCRIRSLVEQPDDDSRRLLEREINDLIVYACFWAEFIRGIDI